METLPDPKHDKLGIHGKKDYEKFIYFRSEPVVFSQTAVKVNQWGFKQERILLMTTDNIYNFKKRALKRKINIGKIGGLIVSEKNPKEVILHIPSEYDYRYILDSERDTFIELLKLQFISRCPRGRLKFFQVPGALKEFTTTEKDMKYNINRVPGDDSRLRDSEVFGSEYTDFTEDTDEDEEVKREESPKEMSEDINDDDQDELDMRGTVLMF